MRKKKDSAHLIISGAPKFEENIKCSTCLDASIFLKRHIYVPASNIFIGLVKL